MPSPLSRTIQLRQARRRWPTSRRWLALSCDEPAPAGAEAIDLAPMIAATDRLVAASYQIEERYAQHIEDLHQAEHGHIRVGCAVCGGEFYRPANATTDALCALCGLSWPVDDTATSTTRGAAIAHDSRKSRDQQASAIHRALLVGGDPVQIASTAHRTVAGLRTAWCVWADRERVAGRLSDVDYQRVSAMLTGGPRPPHTLSERADQRGNDHP